MSAIRDLGMFCGQHPEIRAHSEIGKLLLLAEEERRISEEAQAKYIDANINLAKMNADLLDKLLELQDKYSWQPIETAPANVKVLLLIHIINGYNISIAHRSNLGEIGDQWNTESGTYFHDTSLKMLAGWMPLPSSPKETE
jgi:hypothetical protein